MAKKCSMMIKIMFMMLIMSGISFSEEVAKVIKKPEGIMAFVVVIPLIIIVFMLYKKFDMLVAGFVGGILAMIIGKISLGDANGILLKSIPAILKNLTSSLVVKTASTSAIECSESSARFDSYFLTVHGIIETT